jgi:hypothetical protein
MVRSGGTRRLRLRVHARALARRVWRDRTLSGRDGPLELGSRGKRELALAHAPKLLGCVLIAMAMPKTPTPPVFLLFNASYTLKQELLDWAVKAKPDTQGGFDSKEQAEARLRELLAILCPKDPETELEGFDDWPFQKKAALLTVLHIAALTGVFVYPVRKDGLPEAG